MSDQMSDSLSAEVKLKKLVEALKFMDPHFDWLTTSSKIPKWVYVETDSILELHKVMKEIS